MAFVSERGRGERALWPAITYLPSLVQLLRPCVEVCGACVWCVVRERFLVCRYFVCVVCVFK